MADSLLADIDWTNLDSAEMTTAVKVLCIALQERFNIAACDLEGDFSTSGNPANPSDNILKNMFPYKGNSPRWPLNDGDPLVNYTDSGLAAQDDMVHLIQNAAQHYADIEKWDDAATNKDSGDTRFVLSGVADDPGTYDNRLLEVTGYTTYPDLTVMAPEEVKKLYDMVVIMRFVSRNYNPATQTTAVYRIFNGEFDVDLAAALTVDDNNNGDGGDFYNGGVSTAVSTGTSTPYNDFKTGNTNLFGSSASTFNEDTDTGTFPPSLLIAKPYNISFRRFSGSSYTNFINSFQTAFVVDWDIAQTEVGFIGKPVEYKAQNTLTALTENFPSGHDTSFQFPATTTAINQRYYETVSDSAVGDVVTISRDNLLIGVTLPSTQTSIADAEAILVQAEFSNNLRVFILEDWDADGGFEYYTPAP